MIEEFRPQERTLMGPGPSDISPQVLAALAKPIVGHLDPQFILLMDEIKYLLQEVFQTKNALTLPISAPGSAGMEACFVNLLEAGDKVIVCQNGVFGGRMYENVVRLGGVPVLVEFPWGTAVDPQKVEQVMAAHPDAKILAFVHAETSTGVVSDAQALCAMAKKNNMLTIVDAVTSLAGVPLLVDEWQADAVYSGSQKCLSCVPGISPVTFSDLAVKKIQSRQTPVASWFLDMNLIMGYWGQGVKRAYHHTAPVNALYALHESLRLVVNSGLETSWAKHRKHHLAFVAGIEALGLSIYVDEAIRLPQLNAVTIPDGIDEAKVRQYLLEHYQLEIGAGLGALAGKVWRIGLMGHTCREKNVLLCLGALEAALAAQGYKSQRGAAVDAAANAYSR